MIFFAILRRITSAEFSARRLHHPRSPAPASFPCAAYHVGVLGLAQAAVVAAQCAVQVAVFDVEVVAQDGAAKAQIGAQVEEVAVFVADQLDPERHDLHVAARADG